MKDNDILKIWSDLEDVPFDENSDGELILSEDFYIWKKGTDRDSIWKWFDKNYSKGIYNLLYK